MDDDAAFISTDPGLEEKRDNGVYDVQITREDRYTNSDSYDSILYERLSELEWEDRTYRILDIGSSTGEALDKLLERLEEETPAEFQACALDVDGKVLEEAQESSEPVRAKAQNLPFVEDSFDIVVSANLHLRPGDIDETIEEIDRVLKSPGGRAVLSQGYEQQGYQGLHKDSIRKQV